LSSFPDKVDEFSPVAPLERKVVPCGARQDAPRAAPTVSSMSVALSKMLSPGYGMRYLRYHLMLRTLVRSLSLVAILAGTAAVTAPAEAAPAAQTSTAAHKQARKAKKSARKTDKHHKRKARHAKKRAKAAPAQ
jgi:hypothetical protein